MGNKLIEDIIFGNESDKTLPKTRKEQFIKILKNNYGILILGSFLTFLFIVPSIICLYMISYNLSIVFMNEQISPSNIFIVVLTYMAINIPLIILSGIGISGLLYIIRKMVYDEVFHLSDFFKGICLSIKRTIIIYLLYGISFLILVLNLVCYPVYNELIYEISRVFSIILFIFVNIMTKYMITIEARYNVSFSDLFKNSFILSFKTIFSSLLMLFLCFIPITVLLLVSGPYQIAIIVIMSVTYFGLAILLNYEHSAYVFDKYVNKEKFPLLYKKGISPERN